MSENIEEQLGISREKIEKPYQPYRPGLYDTYSSYPALNTIIIISYVLGFICLIGGIIMFGLALDARKDDKLILIIMSIFIALFAPLVFFARAEFFKLLIRIEENTRRR